MKCDAGNGSCAPRVTHTTTKNLFEVAKKKRELEDPERRRTRARRLAIYDENEAITRPEEENNDFCDGNATAPPESAQRTMFFDSNECDSLVVHRHKTDKVEKESCSCVFLARGDSDSNKVSRII